MSGKEESQRFSHFCPTILFNILKKSGLNDVPEFLLNKIYDKLVFRTIENILLAKYSKSSKGNLCDFLREVCEIDSRIEVLKDIGALILLILDDFETKMMV